MVPLPKVQCWAKRAAVRSVRFSPLPPMQIGRARLHRASVS